jgi:hypothetical protein
MPNNFEQSKSSFLFFIWFIKYKIILGRRENHSSYGGNRANNLNPSNDYLANFSGYSNSNEYGFNLNRYDKNYWEMSLFKFY